MPGIRTAITVGQFWPLQKSFQLSNCLEGLWIADHQAENIFFHMKLLTCYLQDVRRSSTSKEAFSSTQTQSLLLVWESKQMILYVINIHRRHHWQYFFSINLSNFAEQQFILQFDNTLCIPHTYILCGLHHIQWCMFQLYIYIFLFAPYSVMFDTTLYISHTYIFCGLHHIQLCMFQLYIFFVFVKGEELINEQCWIIWSSCFWHSETLEQITS